MWLCGQPRDAKYWHSVCFAFIVHSSSIDGNIQPLSTNIQRIWAPLPDEMMKTIMYECYVPPCVHLDSKLSSLRFDSFHNKFRQRLYVCHVHGTTMRMTDTNSHNRCGVYFGASILPLSLSSFYRRHQHYVGVHDHNNPGMFLWTNQRQLQSLYNAFLLL